LSSFLLSIITSELPLKRLVIKTIPCHELSDRPFKELFEFCNNSESSKLGDLLSEEPSQMLIKTADARPADTAVGPSSDQGYANVQLSYA
jgi:hypothetical protein